MIAPRRLVPLLLWTVACAGEPAVVEADACHATAPERGALRVAGSGSNLALTRAIAERFQAEGGGPVRIPDSIGTSGAIAALRDGAIDVGLASRPLTEAERAEGIVELPVARVAFGVMVHPAAGVRELSAAELAAILRGERPTWPNGRRVVPVLREPGDSGLVLLGRAYPEVGEAIASSHTAGRWLVAYTDQEMRDLLGTVEGAVGFLDVGTARLEAPGLVPLRLEGRAPALHGGYPLVKVLSLLLPASPSAEAARFAEFARSPALDELLLRGGFGRP